MEQRSRSVIGEADPSKTMRIDQNSYEFQQQQLMPQQQQEQEQNPKEMRSLWIGCLQGWMNEEYISGIFGEDRVEVVSVKIFWRKNKPKNGYGFIEFATRAAAEKVLQTYNGTLMPKTEQSLNLNWANIRTEKTRQDRGPEYEICVGNLASDVTSYTLQETFRSIYPSVTRAHVIADMHTGISKGFGFVTFGNETEKSHALREMNGKHCSGQPMNVGLPKRQQQDNFQSTGNLEETDQNSTTGRS